MGLFNKKPLSEKELESRIDKLNKKKKLSKRNEKKLDEYNQKLDALRPKNSSKPNNKLIWGVLGGVVILCCALIILVPRLSSDKSTGTVASDTLITSTVSPSLTQTPSVAEPALDAQIITLSEIPKFTGNAVVEINNNKPYFNEKNYTTSSYEYYSDLDSMGRCGICVSCVGKDLMPTGNKEEIGSIKPTGWNNVQYSSLDGDYLYNRCHLIGYQLTGENANEKNLITGTKYMNVQGMLPYEDKVADYVEHTDNHVLYRVTPVFDGENLLASGVQLEGYSVEDQGKAICFNVFCYNVQPGIILDYVTGESSEEKQQEPSSVQAEASKPLEEVQQTEASKRSDDTSQNETQNQQGQSGNNNVQQQSQSTTTGSYVLNIHTMVFHYPSCSSVGKMKEKNKQSFTGSREELIFMGYKPCGNCHP